MSASDHCCCVEGTFLVAHEKARRVIIALARNSAIRISQETGQTIGLFRRVSLAGMGISIGGLKRKSGFRQPSACSQSEIFAGHDAANGIGANGPLRPRRNLFAFDEYRLTVGQETWAR
jgi:hypothetical protein